MRNNKNLKVYKNRTILYVTGIGIGLIFLFLNAMYHSVYTMIAFALCCFFTALVDEVLLYRHNKEYYEDTKNRKRFYTKITLVIIGEILLILFIVSHF